MRVVVAGGAGFLGSHLCEALLAQGDDVVCADNFVTGTPDNVAYLVNTPGFALVRCNISEPLPQELEGDRFYHLASPASPPRYLERPIETLLTNATGTQHLLERAAACNARLLLASTSEAYGNPLEHPQKETYWGNVSSTGPRSCYDEGKRYAEALTMAFYRERGVDARIIRIFNTYGPRLSPADGRALSNFVAQSIRGEPYTLYGDGRQTRSYCYVSDLIAGMLAMMESDRTSGEVVNLGNPSEIDMLTLVDRIEAITGTHLPRRFGPVPQDDPVRRKPDITKAKRLLHWEPRVNLDEGLRLTIAWFRTVLSGDTPPSPVSGPIGAHGRG
jgi:nucleoside-diphosphate-sugar epimerase